MCNVNFQTYFADILYIPEIDGVFEQEETVPGNF